MNKKEMEEAIKHIESQLECGYIDLSEVHDKNEIEVIKHAMSAMFAIEQIRWERDIAIAQLDELCLSLGQEIDGVYLTKEEYDDLCQYKYMYEDLCS